MHSPTPVNQSLDEHSLKIGIAWVSKKASSFQKKVLYQI